MMRSVLVAGWHLFLVGILVFVVIFWVCLGCWIVVRLALSREKMSKRLVR